MNKKKRQKSNTRSSVRSERSKAKAKKPFHPVKAFFKIVCSIVFAYVFIAGGASFAYYKVTGEMPFAQGGVLSIDATDANLLDALLKRNIKMNVAVMGVDKDGMRTDVMFVVHFDSAQEKLNIVSVPRDTRVVVCDAVAANLKEAGRSYNRETKLNAVHAYSGDTNAPENTVLQLEDLLGIKIDHYVKVDLEAFRAIVDAIGGVDMYVPRDMYWDMRDTGDPLINLKEGQQHLDGDKAEQLVRFRRYADGDVGRIEVQQAFLTALADKILSTETIIKNLPDLVSVMYKYVETDVSLSDAMKYVNYVDKINMGNLSTETLPGVGQYVGTVSYFLHNAEETEEMVERVFRSTGATNASTSQGTATDSKAYTIEVSNGGNVAGLAAAFAQKLEGAGYKMGTVTNFTGTQQMQTRIQVKEAGLGTDLISYFNSAKIEVAPNDIPQGVDIKIIIGTGEK